MKSFVVCMAAAFVLTSAAELAHAEKPFFELKQDTAQAIKDRRWDVAIASAKMLTELHPDDAKAFKDLGFALTKLERRDEAIEVLIRATEIAPGFGEAWNSLCWQHVLAQNLTSARVSCEKAKNTNPGLRSTYVNLGHTYLLEGDVDTAYRWYTESLIRTPTEKAMRDGPLPDFDIFIARSWKSAESAAAAKWIQTRFQQTDMQQLRQAAQLEKDCKTAAKQLKYDAALKLCKQVLETREQILGPNHVELIQPLETLAWIEAQQKRLDAASADLERAKAIVQTQFEADHLYAAETLTATATVKGLRGDYAATLSDVQRALEIRKKLLGPQNMLVAQSLNNVGMALAGLGKKDEAIPFIREAVAISELLEGPRSSNTKAALENLAQMLWSNGQIAESVRIYERIKAIENMKQ